MAPAAWDPNIKVPTMMTTADMALKMRPGIPRDQREVPQRPRGVQGRLRARLVQADPPRHGAQGPLPRPGSPGRGPDLAGPDPRRHHAVGRRRRGGEGEDRRQRPDRQPAGQDRLGLGLAPTASPTTAAAPTARASASRRRRTGTSTSRQMLAKVLDTLDGLRGNLSHGRRDRARRRGRAREGEAPAQRARSPAAAATRPRSRPTPTASR